MDLITPEQLKLGVLWYGVFLFSLVLHEFAHAFMAYRYGDRTAYDAGQVSLNPIPHMQREKLGTIVVPIVSFFLGGWMIGWASAPFNYHWAMTHKQKSAMMALAGPAMNMVIAVTAAILIRVGYMYGVFAAPESINFSHVTEAVEGGSWTVIATVLSIMFSLNLILAVFNLLPLPNFDGSSVLLFFVQGETADKVFHFIHNRGFMFLSVIIAWNLFMYIFNPIHILALNILYPGVSYH